MDAARSGQEAPQQQLEILTAKVDPDAKMYDEITHREALEQGLKVADATAFSLCMDNRMPIIVFNLLTEGNIARAVAGERIGTLVSTPAPDPGAVLSPREPP